MPIVLITQNSQDNVVRVVNELRPGNRGAIVQFLAGSTTFFFFEIVRTGSDAESVLFSLDTCGYFPGLKVAVKER